VEPVWRVERRSDGELACAELAAHGIAAELAEPALEYERGFDVRVAATDLHRALDLLERWSRT
jgi:hypothetical protein